jgi:hypothetical protein
MIQTAEQYEFVHRALCLFERSLPDQSGEWVACEPVALGKSQVYIQPTLLDCKWSSQ